MNSLSWNCRGLGNPRSVRALHDMVRRWKPQIVFLMETKSKIKRMERIKNIIGFANGLSVPSSGRSGGLAMFWTREVNLDINSYSGNHIDAIVRESDGNFLWRIPASMVIQKLTAGMSLGAFLLSFIVNFNFLGSVLVTLMKFCLYLKKRGVSLVLNNKWKVLGM